MTEKSKAEEFVRNKFPELRELRFGCEVIEDGEKATVIKVEQGFSDDGENDMVTTTKCMPLTQKRWRFEPGGVYEIIGHPITLNYWLMALHSYRLLTEGEEYYIDKYVPAGQLLMWHEKGGCIFFNLTTGQPATEEDYRTFNSIVGVNE